MDADHKHLGGVGAARRICGRVASPKNFVAEAADEADLLEIIVERGETRVAERKARATIWPIRPKPAMITGDTVSVIGQGLAPPPCRAGAPVKVSAARNKSSVNIIVIATTRIIRSTVSRARTLKPSAALKITKANSPPWARLAVKRRMARRGRRPSQPRRSR